MAEKGQTSSMTSVTEEDLSGGSESDTTESSYSNITSSLLSSTDTDDKLTPGLFKISISNTKNTAKRTTKHKKQQVETEQVQVDESNDNHLNVHILLPTEVNDLDVKSSCVYDASITTTNTPGSNFVHPYGSNPLPLKYAREDKNQTWRDACYFHPSFGHSEIQPCVNKKFARCKENLGVDDTDGKLSTDFSDTSSIGRYNNNRNNNELDSDNDEDTDRVSSRKEWRPLQPDMSSDKWYQDPCFNRYWSHYRFVMEWYHIHVQAVKVLQTQMIGAWSYPQQWSYLQGPWLSHRGNRRRSQASRKSRRHSAKRKARRRAHRQSSSASLSTAADQDEISHTGAVVYSPKHRKKLNHQDDEEEFEMEITDEMLDFFTTSLKHKLERDKEGEQVHIPSAPTERPGVRRTEEMKELYGTGAPMIQAMETAMQMNFDRFLDKFQPSLWPNMPLKINFTK